MQLGIDGVHLTMVDYDPAWETEGDKCAKWLSEMLGSDALGVQHIGSTAIKGMFGKPVIDLAVLVKDIQTAEKYKEVLFRYDYRYLGEMNPGQRMFERIDPETGLFTHHIHFVPEGAPYWDNYRNIRDYCNAFPKARDRYIAVKKECIASLGGLHEGYNDKKSAFLKELIERAGKWREHEEDAQKKNPTLPNGRHLVVLATSDIHANFCGTDYRTGKQTRKGGLLKAAAYIQKIRKENENVLLLDAGDTLQHPDIPSAFYSSVPEARHIPYAIMHAAGYDAAVPGNHDFDWGEETLKEIIEKAHFPVLCANVFNPDGSVFTGYGYRIFTLSGIRVLVIGAVTPYAVSRYQKKDGKTCSIRFTDPSHAVRDIIEQTRGMADLCVVLAHMDGNGEIDPDKGSDSAWHIARENPEVDLLVCAHTHTAETGEKGNALFAECRDGVTELIRFDLDFDDRGKMQNKSVRLIPEEEFHFGPLPEKTKEAEAFADLVRTYLSSAPEAVGADETIGFAGADFVPGAVIHPVSGNPALSSLLCRAFLEAADADIAVTGAMEKDKVLYRGAITEKMAETIFPFPDYLCKVTLTGDEAGRLFRDFSDRLYFFSRKESSPGVGDSTFTLCVSNFILNTILRKTGGIQTAPDCILPESMQTIWKNYIKEHSPLMPE